MCAVCVCVCTELLWSLECTELVGVCKVILVFSSSRVNIVPWEKRNGGGILHGILSVLGNLVVVQVEAGS